MHIAKWTLLLSVFWLLLSGFLKPLLLTFGALSVAVVIYTVRRMDRTDNEHYSIGTGLRLMRYVPWLIVQIVQSSLHVTKLIWSGPDKVSPRLAKVKADNVPANSRTLYANSITLTPGTLCVDLDNNEIIVHALHKSSIETLQEGEMEKKIMGIWGASK